MKLNSAEFNFIEIKFNVFPLCMQSIRMFLKKKMEGVGFLIQALSKQYVKFQRTIILEELNLTLNSNTNEHLFNINVNTKFNEFPSLTFKDTRVREKPKHYRWMDRKTTRGPSGPGSLT